MIKVIQILFLSFFSLSLTAQSKDKKQPLAWMDVEAVQQKWEEQKRPVLIDVYTDWCYYCKVMDKTTWRNRQLADYVTRFFYPLKFNAENKEPATWMGKTYEYKPVYKVHMLAAEWLMGNMVYPSTVILPPDGSEPIILTGVRDVKELEPILHYFGEKHYLTMKWIDFKAAYQPSWK